MVALAATVLSAARFTRHRHLRSQRPATQWLPRARLFALRRRQSTIEDRRTHMLTPTAISALLLLASPTKETTERIALVQDACAGLELAWKAHLVRDYHVKGHTADGLPFECAASDSHELHDNTDKPTQKRK